MWFRRLVSTHLLVFDLCVNYLNVCVCVFVFIQQSQSNASGVKSEAEPRQVRSRWAEQTDPVIICSKFSPSGVKEGDEEEEKEDDEDFHPQSLEELLGEEEEDKEEKQVGSVMTLIVRS